MSTEVDNLLKFVKGKRLEITVMASTLVLVYLRYSEV